VIACARLPKTSDVSPATHRWSRAMRAMSQVIACCCKWKTRHSSSREYIRIHACCGEQVHITAQQVHRSARASCMNMPLKTTARAAKLPQHVYTTARHHKQAHQRGPRRGEMGSLCKMAKHRLRARSSALPRPAPCLCQPGATCGTQQHVTQAARGGGRERNPPRRTERPRNRACTAVDTPPPHAIAHVRLQPSRHSCK
jgi:hypothetical protein